MKQYRPVEMFVIALDDKDVLTLSDGGHKSTFGVGNDVMGWAQSEYD